MTNSRLHLFVEFLNENPSTGFLKIAIIQFLLKVLFLDFIVVHELEYDAIHEHRLENLGDIQTQGEPAFGRFVKETNRRVKLRAIDFGQYARVHHHVAKGNERIDRILRGLFGSLVEIETVRRRQDVIPCLVVALADVAFDRHQIERRLGLGNLLTVLLDIRNQRSEITVAVVVISKVFEDVEGGRIYDSLRNLHSPLFAFVVFHLLNEEIARYEILARVVRAGVSAVVVENVRGNLVFGQEIEKSRIEIDLREDVEGLDILDGNGFDLRRDLVFLEKTDDLVVVFAGFFGRFRRRDRKMIEEDRVLLPLQAAGGEDVVRSFHS